MKKAVLFFAAAFLLASPFARALADDDHKGNGSNECPVGLVSGKTLDEEFGAGTSAITHCLERRHKVKLLIQINRFCRDNVANAQCTRPYALGNLVNIIDDYEITHGMTRGRDYEIVAVVHDAGAHLLIKNEFSRTGGNQFEGLVKSLMDKGVKFLFCQNTTRGFVNQGFLTAGNATAEIIEGVEYTTAGLTSIADFQSRGYQYVQP